MASSSADFLNHTIDDHINWLIHWNRLAFFDRTNRASRAESLARPDSFTSWYEASAKNLPEQQPAVEALATQHEQLHALARLVLMKTPDGAALDQKDYEAVVVKYQEFIQGLRRIERAFAAAASGLDQLTGLRSRAGLREDLAREYGRFLRNGKPFCVAIMDIDHFKKINDTYGHETGDRVLASVADTVSRSLRSFDDAYRVGGEEFLLCLKEADHKTGLMVLERLRAAMETQVIASADGNVISITASFGFVVSHDGLAPEDMPQQADQALYRAKNEGRNRIVASG